MAKKVNFLNFLNESSNFDKINPMDYSLFFQREMKRNGLTNQLILSESESIMSDFERSIDKSPNKVKEKQRLLHNLQSFTSKGSLQYKREYLKFIKRISDRYSFEHTPLKWADFD